MYWQQLCNLYVLINVIYIVILRFDSATPYQAKKKSLILHPQHI